ncbi:glycosyltransferase [Desulfatitalea alkaliphila]|uniref:Glycosyltransferase n=1 Tax=Desulfatitalea alkaliphila TaxID=2929485 RepID=A0AA41RCD3_9BACT|nr:glycosyltransferase [Desulfatitalea alkaliphila]MCJ8502478.1 glycosyltransferase [Desulfatitalea alkaliphila]
MVNHNSTDCAVRAIESIKRNGAGLVSRIVVVDNASQDGPDRIVGHHPEVRLVLSKRNLGYSRAVNLGMAECRSDYAVIMNPDTVIVNHFFGKVVEFLETHPDVGVVGPRVFDADGSIQGSARRFPTAWSYAFGRKSPLTRFFPNNRVSRKEFMCFDAESRYPMVVDWVSGACMVVRRAAFDAVGGFDNRFFLYWEDTDLCKRIHEAGWRIVYYPGAEMIHIVGMSSSTKPIKSVCHFHHSCYKLFDKHATGVSRLLVPLAFWALAMRCFFVVLLNLVRQVADMQRGQRPPARNARQQPPGNDHRIRVLRIISRLNIGGPSIHVALLTRRLNQQRFDSRLTHGSISAGEGSMAFLLHGCNGAVHPIAQLQREIRPLKDLVALFRLFGLIRRHKPHILHTHTAKAGAIGRLAAIAYMKLTGRSLALVHTFHGNVLEGYFSPVKSRMFTIIERFLAGFTDTIVAISPTQKWELVDRYAIAKAGQVKVIPLGFDLSPFFHAKARHGKGAFRKMHGLDESSILVGIVGRLVPIKNHHLFLEAARDVLSARNHPPVQFAVIGDGELRRALETYARDLGIGLSVFFCGWTREVDRVYADLDVLALTSINEGTPVSIIEAMAAGVPVITTKAGGVQDLMGKPLPENGRRKGFAVCRRGIMCANSDPAAFAEGLRFLINGNEELRATRTQHARRFVAETYSEQRLVRDIEALYEQLIGNKGD